MSGVPPLPQLQPGQQPTQDQINQINAHINGEAQRLGITPAEYIERLKAQAMEEMKRAQQAEQQNQGQNQNGQQQQQQQQAQQQQQQQQPINPGPPKPEALAVANFLKAQDMKPRTCIFQEKRKDMFKVKRAIRALQSPAYEKARKKNPLLPEVHNRASAENTFKLLPLSMLALRVAKIDADQAHEGHGHGKVKRVKGLWNVKIEQHQETADEMHYMWLWEGSQWKQKAYAIGALVLVFIVVLFPLWPYFMRKGVWYLSMGMLGLIGLFFAMAIFRLILYCVTSFTSPPGFWLFPNLFEDVGFFESFVPLWGWHETTAELKAKLKAKRVAKRAKREAANGGGAEGAVHNHASHDVTPAETVDAAKETNSTALENPGNARQRIMNATVEEDSD